jgi:hypothetical protein
LRSITVATRLFVSVVSLLTTSIRPAYRPWKLGGRSLGWSTRSVSCSASRGISPGESISVPVGV